MSNCEVKAAADRFFDLSLSLMDADLHETAVPSLIGYLQAMRDRAELWPMVRDSLAGHSLHGRLLQDPMASRSFSKPRGYAGDAELIDMIYFSRAPLGTTVEGQKLMALTCVSTSAIAVRTRRDHAERRLHEALTSGARVLSLACGHFREGDNVPRAHLGQITLVDQDPISLDLIRTAHGADLRLVEANAFAFLREASRRGETWDYIYTLGLTDYFDEKAMALFHRLLKKVLSPDGRLFLANFMPDHLTTGWMEAVMEWHLVYRHEEDLAAHARAVDLSARTWTDPTRSIAYCEMHNEPTTGLAGSLQAAGA